MADRMERKTRSSAAGGFTAAMAVWSLAAVAVLTLFGHLPSARADGTIVRPLMFRSKPYKGSLQETAQEAIIIFKPGRPGVQAQEDLILKISVEGEVDRFGWIIPFPTKPKTAREDPRLFKELHGYVQARLRSRTWSKARVQPAMSKDVMAATAIPPVQVLSRKVVGNFDVAVVRENQPGALNWWLKKEGYLVAARRSKDVPLLPARERNASGRPMSCGRTTWLDQPV